MITIRIRWRAVLGLVCWSRRYHVDRPVHGATAFDPHGYYCTRCGRGFIQVAAVGPQFRDRVEIPDPQRRLISIRRG